MSRPPPTERARFATLFLAAEPALRGFVSSVMARPAEREDMVQEVALILWREFTRYDAARPFLPWACGIAARRMKEEWRRASRRPDVLPPEAIEAMAGAAGAEAAETARRESALANCLAALPTASARLVSRRYTDRCSIESLAAESGQTADAVYQSLSRLRRRLAECISRRLAQEESGPSLSPASSPRP